MNNNIYSIEKVAEDYARSINRSLAYFKVLKVLNRPLSIVTRLLIKTDDGETGIIYVKYIKDQQGKDMASMAQRDYETSLFWWERFKNSEDYNVIEPLYLDAQKRLIITRESFGQDLQIYLTKLGQLFPSAQAQSKIREMIRLVGGWLNYFQSIPIEGDPISNPGLDALLEYINLRMDRIVAKTNIGFDTTLQQKVNDFIKTHWQNVLPEDNAVCYLHSDLSLSNVLVNENHITVLDFTKQETGSVYKDLTRFYHQLTLLSYKPTFQNKFINDLKENFLIGYGKPELDKHPLFQIYLMTHIINHLGKSARFWEQSPRGRLYNRWVVYNVMQQIRQVV